MKNKILYKLFLNNYCIIKDLYIGIFSIFISFNIYFLFYINLIKY